LKAMHGEQALPAVPHRRLQIYHEIVNCLQENRFPPENLLSILKEFHQKNEYRNLAESALAGSAFFLHKAGYSAGFQQLCEKMDSTYRPYTDKGNPSTKRWTVDDNFRQVMPMLYQGTRSRRLDVQTAKMLYELAESAVRLCTEETLSAPVQEEEPKENQSPAYN
ncbi:MAG: hypothetical protein K2G25_08200, partial [Oscillospiraceae bacterium]|nr:hypothetical protein [Oscillospiraceae bacterium]